MDGDNHPGRPMPALDKLIAEALSAVGQVQGACHEQLWTIAEDAARRALSAVSRIHMRVRLINELEQGL